MTGQLAIPFAQRWTERRESWQTIEPFDPSRYEVAPLDQAEARAFVERHHYSGTFPAARFSFGVYRAGHLVGCAVYSVPVNQRSISNFLPVEPAQGVELGRLVLVDEVPGNAESWFVARTFRTLHQEHGIRGVLSFSDPMARTSPAGDVITPGHVGIVYQALSATYAGTGTPRTLHFLNQTGQVFSARTMQKIRAGERGWRGALDTLRQAGARAYSEGEDRAEYMAEVLRSIATTRPHPGNHRYIWGLDRHTKRALPPSLPYPRHPAGRVPPRYGRKAEVAA
jgi:hypothetical protein